MRAFYPSTVLCPGYCSYLLQMCVQKPKA
uniref:Uncharacterized protein n=1 Tax=Anguilla anguilla TaxID=7936 RepID=A0A0E9UEH9_ANGAN